MKKYIHLFSVSLDQELAYRVNFLMWRVRSIISLLLLYFLWDAVFRNQSAPVFGYTRATIMSYVWGVLILQSFVTSTRSQEVAGEISRGDLSNYLLKPVSYFKYWFTRDLASKALNFIFVIIEAFVLYLILRPEIQISLNPLYILLFFLSLVGAVIIYFLLLMITSMFPFWYPQEAWGSQFLLFIFSDFLSGAVFPLDVLPEYFYKIIMLTPFPYLIFVPLNIITNRFTLIEASSALAISFCWIVILTFALEFVWKRGLKAYRAEGR